MLGIPFGAACLLLLAWSKTTGASVTLESSNITFDPIPSLPADFGPAIPDSGLEGLLYLANPQDACSTLTTPPGAKGKRWVALIKRTQGLVETCTFDRKVAHAEAAGASAAIVHDQSDGPLIIMSKPLGALDPGIPAVFISLKSGIMLKQLLQPGISRVFITNSVDAFFIDMIGTLGICMVLSVMLAVWLVRRQRIEGGVAPAPGRGPGGMSAEDIRALPIVVYERRRRAAGRGGVRADAGANAEPMGAGGHASGPGGIGGSTALPASIPDAGAPPASLPRQPAASSTSDSDGEAGAPRAGGSTRRTCAICLDNYVDGDKLRALPCQHHFHAACIDQWLSSRTTLCPVCKGDAAAGAAERAGAGAGDEGQGAPAGARGLLRRARLRLARLWHGPEALTQALSSPPREDERRGLLEGGGLRAAGSPGSPAAEIVPASPGPELV
ncbi:hypothetical protein ACKKBF_B02240 [Auxenochlorella protothecoides x Auxenochlorella symbiontica]